MPVVMVAPNDGGRHPVPRYSASFGPDFGQVGASAIRNLRKGAVADREFFASVRNQCGRVDPVGARWASDEVKAAARLEKACTLALRWIDADVGATSPRQWALEMTVDLDRALSAAYLAEGLHQDGILEARALCSRMQCA